MSSISKRIIDDLMYLPSYAIFPEITIRYEYMAIVNSIQAVEDLLDNNLVDSSDLPIVMEGVLIPARLIVPKMLKCSKIVLIAIKDEDDPEVADVNILLNEEGVVVKGRIEEVSIKEIRYLSENNRISKMESLGRVLEEFIESHSSNIEDTYIFVGYKQKLTLCINTDLIDDTLMEEPTAIGRALKPTITEQDDKIIDASGVF